MKTVWTILVVLVLIAIAIDPVLTLTIWAAVALIAGLVWLFFRLGPLGAFFLLMLSGGE